QCCAVVGKRVFQGYGFGGRSKHRCGRTKRYRPVKGKRARAGCSAEAYFAGAACANKRSAVYGKRAGTGPDLEVGIGVAGSCVGSQVSGYVQVVAVQVKHKAVIVSGDAGLYGGGGKVSVQG